MILIATAAAGTIALCNKALGNNEAVLVVSAAEHLYDTVRKVQPSLTLVDLELENLEGAAGVLQVKRAHPGTRILALNVPKNEQLECDLFRSGARGICPPGANVDHIGRAAESLMRGELWMRRGLINRLLEHYVVKEGMDTILEKIDDAPLGTLTLREREIATMVGAGCNNKQVARALDIAERTVKAHLTEIFRKLGVSDRLGLALKVRTTNAVQPAAVTGRPIPFIHHALPVECHPVLS